MAKEKHTSKGMVIVVHLSECPPSDQGVGCEHGTQGCPYSISAIHGQMEVLFHRRWGALLVVVIKDQPWELR